MDQSTPPQPPVSPPPMVAPKNQLLKNKFLIIGICILLVIGVIALILKLSGQPSQTKIAKVGTETLYQKDLDTELAAYPVIKGVDASKLLQKKLISDSIILQGAAADKIITLDPNVFNSVDKNYEKRLQLIAQAKKSIQGQSDHIQGTIVSIWFSNSQPGPAGYEKGKQIAYAQISKLYNDVKSGKITIEQAGEAIKNDSELAQVDPAYAANALIPFEASGNSAITFDKPFNTMLWNLPQGQLTPLYLAKDKDYKTKQMIDAVYMFAQVSQRKTDTGITDFQTWYDQKQKLYEVTLY